ncbi:hypothetical protein AB0E69_33740 [Kribbella sp. NPDC026611]|uniref:hypothetical protein n=1 Tax=Kribbella sp. NPDC026611 TaxID=3154911 RepID=UPI0034017C99
MTAVPIIAASNSWARRAYHPARFRYDDAVVDQLVSRPVEVDDLVVDDERTDDPDCADATLVVESSGTTTTPISKGNAQPRLGAMPESGH